MATGRCVASVNIQHPGTMVKGDVDNHEISQYELSREERIKENQERMQKLGIVDLSLKLKTLQRTPNSVSRRKAFRGQDRTPPPQPWPVRRSSRLQNSTPISYCEVKVERKDESLDGGVLPREEGSKPEIYTVEHEKLLGSTEMSWTFFVDGYGKDGKRIYDPVNGKTCHQCRQKTLGYRTHCKECNMVQGQFCGDCLYMRYGENVLEAKENPDWICPVCRGICNCSLCRQAKGWPPTGPLYRKISSLGFKSVAHYLIQTRGTDANNVVSKVPISSKRSLPFSDIEAISGEDDLFKSLNSDPPTKCDKTKMSSESCEDLLSLEPSATILSNDQLGCLSTEQENDGKNTVAEPLSISKAHEGGPGTEIKKEDPVNLLLPTKSMKKRVCSEPTPDSIAGRLRQRRRKSDGGDHLQSTPQND